MQQFTAHLYYGIYKVDIMYAAVQYVDKYCAAAASAALLILLPNPPP